MTIRRVLALVCTVVLLLAALAAAVAGGWLLGEDGKAPYAVGAIVGAVLLAGLAALGRTGPRGRDFDN